MRGDIKREREKDVRHSVGLESEYQHYVYSFDPHGAQPLFNVMFIVKAHVTASLSHVTHQRTLWIAPLPHQGPLRAAR